MAKDARPGLPPAPRIMHEAVHRAVGPRAEREACLIPAGRVPLRRRGGAQPRRPVAELEVAERSASRSAAPSSFLGPMKPTAQHPLSAPRTY